MAKKYYWLKLQKDFFKRHDIRIIEDMPNGKDYILFYMKLLVESISHEGNLRFNETIPYNETMLSTITNTNIDIVRTAVKLFGELGLMDLMEDGTLYMNEVQSMMGVETDWAEKKRLYRDTKKLEGQKKTLSDKSKIKSKSLEIDKELKKEVKHKHGEYKKVLLTDTQYSKLLKDWGEEKTKTMIINLDEGIQMKGYIYKDHNLAIRQWKRNDDKKNTSPLKSKEEEIEVIF